LASGLTPFRWPFSLLYKPALSEYVFVMPDFSRLSEIQGSGLADVFKLIDSSRQSASMASDSNKPIPVSAGDTKAIQQILVEEIRSGIIADGFQFQTLSQIQESTIQNVTRAVADGFFNPVNGIGSTSDPGYWNSAYTPISMSPNEVTAYYSSGGIPRIIIDKKAGGVMMNGFTFEGEGWTKEDLEKLKKHADELNFDQALEDSLRDGLSYGGSLLVPQLKDEDALTMQMSPEELSKQGRLKVDCLDRFWSADRWNAIMIPDYNISARDYLHPREIFVPITGYTVNTKRAALIKPKTLPYWGALRQLGWGISDMEGWIKSVLAYEICIASIPIMSQQLSLLFRVLPLDAVTSQNGAAYAQEIAEKTQLILSKASNVTPRTINAVGDIKVIERHFTGFEELVHILRQDVGAQSEISDTVLFNTQATGFSKNEGDTTLKQAETITKIGNKIIPQLQPVVKMIVYSCFGYDSEQGKRADKVRLCFDSPTVLTNEERNQAGSTYAAVLTAEIGSGAQIGDAHEIAKAFVPDIQLPQNILDRMSMEPDMLDESAMEVSEDIKDLGARLRGESTEALQELGDKVRGEGEEEIATEGIGLLTQQVKGRTMSQKLERLGSRSEGGNFITRFIDRMRGKGAA
jgi:hypothetical protein